MLAIFDRSRPDIYRNGEINEITTEAAIGSMTLDHRFSESNALRAGILLTSTRSQWPDRARDRSVGNQIVFADHHMSYELTDGLRYDGSLGG